MRRWTHRPRDANDGLRDEDLGPRANVPSAAVRDFALGSYVEGRGTVGFERVPRRRASCTPRDDRADWLRAGQALHRVLLAATVQDLSCSLLTQPLERQELRWLLRPPRSGTGVPQVLLRLGYGPQGAASRRRAVADVLVYTSTRGLTAAVAVSGRYQADDGPPRRHGHGCSHRQSTAGPDRCHQHDRLTGGPQR